MAPDASGPSLKSASVAGRLEGSFQTTGSPLSAKAPQNTITSAPPQTRTTPQKRRADFLNDRDSDSSLSEFEGGDSDAETERLHISPQKQRPGIMVQHTGSSTGTATALAPQLIPLGRDNASKPGDEPTEGRPTRSNPGTPTRSPSKKRKRDTLSPAPVLPPEDPESRSVLPPPPKKKVHTPGTATDKETVETTKTNASDSKDRPATNGDAGPKNTAATNGNNHHPSKPSKTPDATVVPMEVDQPADEEAEDEEPEQTPSAPLEEETADSVDVAQEEEEDAEKEEVKKQKAIEELAEIEKMFAKLKDSLYNDKLHRVEIEMKMLMDGTHPEYVAQKKCIDERLEEKVRLADAQYRHAMESLTLSTTVNRAQLHSQYFQQARQLREDALYNCSELWYSIQRERRAGDALVPEYTFKISERQSTRVRQRMQYNWEVQILGGIQKHIGFPAAPDVNGATEEETADDLEALGIPPRAVTARSIAPAGVIRMEDLTQHNWAHHSPPSPVGHAGAPQQMQQLQQQQMQQQQQAQHPAHIHRHHHHHHRHVSQPASARLQTQQEQPTYPPPLPRRVQPSTSNLGPPPSSSASLSSLLHPPPESSVKMEPSQTSLPSFKNSEVYSNFPNHLTQQPQRRPSPYSIAHHMPHPFSRAGNNDSPHPPPRMDGRRSPAERILPRDHELEMKRMKEDASQTGDRMGGGGGGGLRGSLYRPGGGLSYA